MTVAVIDIGSNSIKILVAARRPDARIEALTMHTVDARISAGISKAHPRLGEEGMACGLAAIQELLAHAAPFAPDQTLLVATSAVRGAENGAEFIERVRTATGHSIRVLTGDEEAVLIGRGLTCDPALTALRDFYVFDLGGGSLECLAFRERALVAEASLPLGCVRLTERFIADSSAPLPAEERIALADHTRAMLLSGFAFELPAGAVAVFSGGSMTSVRAIFGARIGRRMSEAPSLLRVADIRALLEQVASLPLAARRRIPGLPEARADVFPAALVTLLTVAEVGGFDHFQHSLYNLRWGLADTAISG